jgi:hypothetical protein
MAFEHTERVEALLRQGKRREAAKLHNRHLDEQFAKARRGEVINLSDAEHFVREAQRCILYWKGDDPKAMPLESAEHVWFFLTVSTMKDEAIVGASFG